jgi:hypothetical protein
MTSPIASFADMCPLSGSSGTCVTSQGMLPHNLPTPGRPRPNVLEILKTWYSTASGMTVGDPPASEVIAAVGLGMRVCGLSLITNRAGSNDDSHDRVLKAGTDNGQRIARVLEALVAGLRGRGDQGLAVGPDAGTG